MSKVIQGGSLARRNYLKAQELLKTHKLCGNDAYGCGEVFRTEDMHRTICYGQVYYWCKRCYENIK